MSSDFMDPAEQTWPASTARVSGSRHGGPRQPSPLYPLRTSCSSLTFASAIEANCPTVSDHGPSKARMPNSSWQHGTRPERNAFHGSLAISRWQYSIHEQGFSLWRVMRWAKRRFIMRRFGKTMPLHRCQLDCGRSSVAWRSIVLPSPRRSVVSAMTTREVNSNRFRACSPVKSSGCAQRAFAEGSIGLHLRCTMIP